MSDDPLAPYRMSEETVNDPNNYWRIKWAKAQGWEDVGWLGDNTIGWALVGTPPGDSSHSPVPLEIIAPQITTDTPNKEQLAILDVINALRAVVTALTHWHDIGDELAHHDAETLLNLLADAEAKLQLP